MVRAVHDRGWQGGGLARGCAYQQRKPERIIPAGARPRLPVPRGYEPTAPGPAQLTPVVGPVGPECAPCWDNPSLSGSLPPGEWRTINFTTPPTLTGQWSVVGSRASAGEEGGKLQLILRSPNPASELFLGQTEGNECQIFLIVKERLGE